MNVKTEKKRYQTPEMEICQLEETDIITSSTPVQLTERSIKQTQVDNSIADSSARWDTDNSPLN